MTEKPARTVSKRPSSRASKAKTRMPDHNEISKRAYFIALEEGSDDELGNWLRAERELTAA